MTSGGGPVIRIAQRLGDGFLFGFGGREGDTKISERALIQIDHRGTNRCVLTALAQAGGKIEQPEVHDDDDLEGLDITEEQHEVLFGILHAAKAQVRVINSKPIEEP